ncbi:hypothetical protein [Actinoallomurus sp. CA-142502]|uniref:hypothetical protein n=1 Tax=Actinoallomurus sp. CA-142502 TaxID=3239885 RepID=UPI003D8C7F13
MAFHPIENVPAVRLAHMLGKTERVRSTTYHYMTYPIDSPRPADGVATVRVYCGNCDTTVQVTIPSAAEVRKLRSRRLAVAVPGLIFGIAMIAAYNSSVGGGNGLWVLFGLAGFIVALVAFGMWWSDHGVRVSKSESVASQGMHSVRTRQRDRANVRS